MTAAFLTHPLLANLCLEENQPREWECPASVPDADSYVMLPRPLHAEGCMVTDSEWGWMAANSRVDVIRCLMRERVQVAGPFCAIIDMRSKTLHHIDLVGERDGRPCLIFLYYTHRKITKRKEATQINRHMDRITALCRDQYASTVSTLAINVYFRNTVTLGVRVMPRRERHSNGFPPPS
jgi:hypothetical protein